MISNRELFSL